MTAQVLHGRAIHPGVAEGPALVSTQGIALCAGTDPYTGIITERKHQLRGENIRGTVLVFPYGKGSSAFTKFAYGLWLAGNAPAAWIVRDVNPQTALASLVLRIPAITDLDSDPITAIKTGDWIRVDGNRGEVVIVSHALQQRGSGSGLASRQDPSSGAMAGGTD